jgi:hypothetical protein
MYKPNSNEAKMSRMRIGMIRGKFPIYTPSQFTHERC